MGFATNRSVYAIHATNNHIFLRNKIMSNEQQPKTYGEDIITTTEPFQNLAGKLASMINSQPTGAYVDKGQTFYVLGVVPTPAGRSVYHEAHLPNTLQNNETILTVNDLNEWIERVPNKSYGMFCVMVVSKARNRSFPPRCINDIIIKAVSEVGIEGLTGSVAENQAERNCATAKRAKQEKYMCSPGKAAWRTEQEERIAGVVSRVLEADA